MIQIFLPLLRLMKLIINFSLILPSLLLLLSYSAATFTFLDDGDDIYEYPQSIYQATKYFVVMPILDSLKDLILRFPLLPSDIKNYDAFGNLIADPKDLLRNKPISQKMLNFTEKFKEMYEALYIGRGGISEDGWDDPWEIIRMPKNTKFELFQYNSEKKGDLAFSPEEIEESAEYWESRGSEADYFIESMPKTFSTFPDINVPKRSRFAHVLETYLIDLCRLFYPFIEESDLDSFEDLLTLVLFHVYIHLKDDNRVYQAYARDLIEDLRKMGTILSLPSSKNSGKLDRMACLQNLIENVVRFSCFYTFQVMIQSKMINTKSSFLIKYVLSCEHEKLIKYFIKVVDRNVEIANISPNYNGRLCHAVYLNEKDWLMLELLKYDDVEWDAVDSRGYTVLGTMIQQGKTLDERYRTFLKLTSNFIHCYESESEKRNILEECVMLKENVGDRHGLRGLSKFVTYLKERNSDDYSPLLVSAALINRPDYFARILETRAFNCCHELDSAFQSIYHHMKLGCPFLYPFLVKILVQLQSWHGKKGYKLEHVFFMKWDLQLASYRAAADEMGIEIN